MLFLTEKRKREWLYRLHVRYLGLSCLQHLGAREIGNKQHVESKKKLNDSTPATIHHEVPAV